VQNNSISSGSSSLSLSSEDLSVSNKKVNLLSHPLTKAQLEKAKSVIDNKLDINRNLPDKQAYIDKEGHIKVAKVTRYIPTNLILTKSGELVLKNAQQQVDYMNFIGESSSTGTENKKKNISNNENINLQIQKLMNKVNHLSASINNTQQAHTQESVINNPFINSTGDDVTFGNNFSVSINAGSREEADRLFSGLSNGGKVIMPMETTFWGAYFGMFVDQFGINWMINFDEVPQ